MTGNSAVWKLTNQTVTCNLLLTILQTRLKDISLLSRTSITFDITLSPAPQKLQRYQTANTNTNIITKSHFITTAHTTPHRSCPMCISQLDKWRWLRHWPRTTTQVTWLVVTVVWSASFGLVMYAQHIFANSFIFSSPEG